MIASVFSFSWNFLFSIFFYKFNSITGSYFIIQWERKKIHIKCQTIIENNHFWLILIDLFDEVEVPTFPSFGEDLEQTLSLFLEYFDLCQHPIEAKKMSIKTGWEIIIILSFNCYTNSFVKVFILGNYNCTSSNSHQNIVQLLSYQYPDPEKNLSPGSFNFTLYPVESKKVLLLWPCHIHCGASTHVDT